MKTRNHNLLSLAFSVPISLAIVISVPRFTTWGRRGGGGTQTSSIFEGLCAGASTEGLIGKLRIGCGCLYWVEAAGS